MTSAPPHFDEHQKELCAVAAMRSMLEDYCAENHIPFDDAFFRFVSSRVYSVLFDYSTGLWKEGPDYLRDLFELQADT